MQKIMFCKFSIFNIVLLIFNFSLSNFIFCSKKDYSIYEGSCNDFQFDNFYCKVINKFLAIEPIEENVIWRICIRIILFRGYEGEDEVICISEEDNGKTKIKYKTSIFNLFQRYNEYEAMGEDPVKMSNSLMKAFPPVECTITEEEYPGIKKFVKKLRKNKSKLGIRPYDYYNPHATEYEIWIESKMHKPFYIVEINEKNTFIKIIKKLQKKIHKLRATEVCLD